MIDLANAIKSVLICKLLFFLAGGAVQAQNLAEDCIVHRLSSLEAHKVGGRWKTTEGNHWLLDFDQDGASARTAFEVLHIYNADRICYVERPHPPMMYILDGSSPPIWTPNIKARLDRAGITEDCIPFDQSSLKIRHERNGWLLESSLSRMLMFRNEGEADKALAVIRKYGFTAQCFVGRPNPEFRYFRR